MQNGCRFQWPLAKGGLTGPTNPGSKELGCYIRGNYDVQGFGPGFRLMDPQKDMDVINPSPQSPSFNLSKH